MPIYKTGKTKDGKQGYRVRVNYTDANGNYLTKTQVVYGSPEAKMAEQAILAGIGELANTSSMTVNDLFDRYIEAKRSQVRETTLTKSAHIISNHILPFFGKIRLDKIDTPKLQEWKNSLSSQALSVPTLKNIYGQLRTLLNFAVKMDYLPKNPIYKIDNFKEVYFEKPQDKLAYYTPEQWKKFSAAAEQFIDKPADRACYIFFNIAYYTGMRKGEINALKWSDIDGDIIHIRRSVSQKIKGKSVTETPPKNKSSYRDIQIPKRLRKLLDEHRAYQATANTFSEDFRVCGGPSCVSDTSIENRNIKYSKLAELPHIRIHDFRHSHASLLANEGINIQEIARRLGHAKIEMTWNTYAHLYPREEERAIKVLDNI